MHFTFTFLLLRKNPSRRQLKVYTRGEELQSICFLLSNYQMHTRETLGKWMLTCCKLQLTASRGSAATSSEEGEKER